VSLTSTTTALSASPAPSTYASGVTLTATVTPASGSGVGGSATFYDGGSALGTAVVAWNGTAGVATFTTVTGLAVGSHTLSAIYSGDATFAPSTSAGLSHTVTKRTVTVDLFTPAGPLAFGQVATLTAQMGLPIPTALPQTGTVTFYDGASALGSAPCVPRVYPGAGEQSQATLAVTSLAVGTHASLTAAYGGDGTYNAATSADVSLTVTKGNTSTALSSSANPAAACQSVALTARVAAVAPATGTPTGTVTFLEGATALATLPLAGGLATYTTAVLTTATHTLSSSYLGDTNFNSSLSPNFAQVVTGAVSLALAASAAVADPVQGSALDSWDGRTRAGTSDGNLEYFLAAATPARHTACDCPCACKDDGATVGAESLLLKHNTRTASPKPIILATLATDFCGAVPSSIAAQLTWAGTPQGTVTFATTGHNPGDVYHLPLQVGTAVTASGIYAWSVATDVTIGGTTYHPSASGVLPVVANTSSPFGAGWSLGGFPSLLLGSAGVAVVDNGAGSCRYFSGTPGALPFTYTNPANDQGQMKQNADTSFTYTAKDQTKTNFDSTGRVTSKVDPHGLTESYSYASPLSTITAPDGGVATFTYSSGLLQTVAQPGGRVLTLTYDGSGNLVGLTDAAGGLHTFAYDGSHRLTNARVGPLSTTFTYASDGTVRTIDRGLGTLTTIVAAAAQGLGAATAINASQAVAVVTDPLGHVTTTALDALGRPTRLETADGAARTWALNAAGNPTVYTDPLGRVTTNTYDGSEDLTQVQFPDGTFATFAYHPTFHYLTQAKDALGRLTTLTYDDATGDQLTAKDALGHVTTFTWVNGLKQTMTDALGRVTSYSWDAVQRRLLAEIDALGHATSFGYDGAGNRTTVQDALGRVTTSSFDGERRPLTRTNALGGVASSTYDMAGDLLTQTDELRRVTTFGYDARGLRVSVTEPLSMDPVFIPGAALPLGLPAPLGSFGPAPSRVTTTAYDVATNVLSVTDALGDVVSFAYDALNRPVARLDAYGTALQRATTTNYDPVGNVISTIDGRGTTTSFAYDLLNRPTARLDAYGNALQRATSTGYDAVGNAITMTDPLGNVTTTGYDALNRPVTRTDALGNDTTTAFDAVSNTLSVTNAVGAVVSFGYDALNRRTLVVEAQGAGVQRATTTTFDAVGNTLTVTNPRGYVASFAYDALNRQTIRTEAVGDALQRTTTAAYDAVGNVVSATNTRGVTDSFGYDALNRRTTQTDAFGTALQRTATTAYDAADNVTAVTDPLGFLTAFGYDALNRRVTVRDAGGGVVTTTFDADDNVVTSTDQLGHTATFGYDVLNRKTTATDARGGVVTLSYDANDNLTGLTDPVGNTTAWLYDALNRKSVETDPLSNVGTWAYDAVSRVASSTDKNGQTLYFTYDLLNRQTSATGFAGTGLLTFTFDPNDNLLTAQTATFAVTQTFDALDRLATVKDGFGNLTTNTFDAANNRTVFADSFGGQTTRTFDALDRTTTVQFSGQGTALREDFAYTARDQVSTQKRYSDLAAATLIGSSTLTYDALRRLVNQQHLNGSGTNIVNFTNTYDLASRITAEVLNGGAPTTYQYDATDQLTNDAVNTYTYDLNGNRTMAGYATGPGNQLTSDGTWNYYADRNGNIVQKTNIATGEVEVYGFDTRNRLAKVSDTTSVGLQLRATYSYDAPGRRIEKDVWAGGVTTVTRFANDNGQVWADTDGSNALQVRHLLGEQVLERLARVTGAGTPAWLLPDRMGSVRNVVDAGGIGIDTIAYDGYGNIFNESNLINGGAYKFAGYRFDAELASYRPDSTVSRIFNPATGRWNAIDPILFNANDPNPWRYVRNAPTNNLDPSGLDIDVSFFEGANIQGAKGRHLEALIGRLRKDPRLKDLPIKYTGYSYDLSAPFTQYNRTAREIKERLCTPTDPNAITGLKRGKPNYNRSVLIGFSFGGAAVTKILPALTSRTATFELDPIQIDLVITIDPVPPARWHSGWINDAPEFGPILIGQIGYQGPSIREHWLNWYQKSDTQSLLGGIKGSPIPGGDRTLPVPMLSPPRDGKIGVKEWRAMPCVTNYGPIPSRLLNDPEKGHISILDDKTIYEAIVKELLRLAETPFRDDPTMQSESGPILKIPR
jgi:RHS repeat-associated protein